MSETGTQSADTRTFGERVSAAMAEVVYLEKKGWNTHFKYAFVQEAEVKRAASEAIRKHGLMIRSVSYSPVGECGGKAATIHCSLRIGDVKGAEEVEFEGIGSGADSSDKAPMKAMAAALKYALTSGFLIATGDDPEEDDGKTSKKTAKSEPAADPDGQDSHENDGLKKDAVEVMLETVAACASLEELGKLRGAVSKLRGEEGFAALAEAFKAKGAALKAASEKEAA